jgi:hypothetical protein
MPEGVQHAIVEAQRSLCWMDCSVPLPLTNPAQNDQAACEYGEWDPELYVSEDCPEHRWAWAGFRNVGSHKGELLPQKDYMQTMLIAKFCCLCGT